MKFIPFFVIIPLAAAFLIALLGKWIRRFPEILSTLIAFVLLALSLNTIKPVIRFGTLVYKMGGWPQPLGISLVIDGLSIFVLVLINLIAFLTLLYAFGYIKKFTEVWKFYSLFMLMLAGLNGVVVSADFFNFYIFLEVASIAAYCLVAFGIAAEDLEAAFKYAVMGSLASLFILLGIGIIYSYASSLNMADVALILADKPNVILIGFVSVLFLVGFSLKAALVPFHAWLPDAHSSAPTPVSAMLSGVVIKVLGVYTLARIFFNVLGVSNKLLFVLMILGILSMVIGAILAIIQNDTKRMFAYSSISQIGYIVFALGIGTPLAILGALFHLFNHAVFKSLLFLNAGAIEEASGTRQLSKLGGLNVKLPVTGWTSLVGAMSISGIPPLGGFWSKFIIIFAAVQAGYISFAIIAVIVSIITLAYYLKFQTFAFWGKPMVNFGLVKDITFSMKLATVILALICIFSGLLLCPGLKDFLYSAANVLSSPLNYKFSALLAP